MCLGILAAAGLLPAAALAEQADEFSPQQISFFESKVRPLLAQNCFKCHGPAKQKAGLRLDSRQSILAGGESGPAIVVGSPAESLLVEAINYAGLEMPPYGKLSERQIETLTRWIEIGAPWPAEEAARATEEGEFQITAEDRAYWAFQPIRRPPPPLTKTSDWEASPLDAFVLSRLEAKQLAPNAPADRRTLLRRAYFDLIGLPPTPEEVDAFVKSESATAFEQVIDELLAREQFGERWGRHWLDVVRFGQTNGYERDDEKEEAWRFRDYVIKSFNEDKPIDRFILEQLAGDELDDVTRDSIIATGFYRIGVWDDEPAEKTLARMDELDDIVRVTGSAFLGLTVGCARCHNHMFDPLSQRDYYEFLAFFQNVAQYGRDKDGNSETHWELNPDAIYTPIIPLDKWTQWQKQCAEAKPEIERLTAELDELGSDAAAGERKQEIEAQIKKLRDSLKPPSFERALSVRENGPEPKPTHLLIRGDPQRPSAQVEPAIPAILNPDDVWSVSTAFDVSGHPLKHVMSEQGVKPTSGRRRAVAQWIASANNPLTARVFVNRMWQHLFGHGIVRTPNNFGRAGSGPTHSELLDWLAAEFVDGGWKLKRLIKTIMLSRAYQTSSRNDNETAEKSDPANELFWRQNMRRLEAEAVRDSILAVSGKLNLQMGGRGFFPELSDDVLATQSKPGHNWGKSSEAELNRRSVYIFVKRTLMVPMLEAFDYTNTAEPLGVRPVTTVAPQALMLLNDKFVEQQAAAFAERILTEAGDDRQEQIERVFQLSLGREPLPRERAIARDLIDRQVKRSLDDEKNAANEKDAKLAALKSLCLIVFNLNEFVYID